MAVINFVTFLRYALAFAARDNSSLFCGKLRVHAATMDPSAFCPGPTTSWK